MDNLVVLEISILVLCVLVAVDLILHGLKFYFEVNLYRRSMATLTMLEGDLVIGKLQREKIESVVRDAYLEGIRAAAEAKRAAAVAATEVKQAVERVPDKVVEKMAEGTAAGGSGVMDKPKLPKSQ